MVHGGVCSVVPGGQYLFNCSLDAQAAGKISCRYGGRLKRGTAVSLSSRIRKEVMYRISLDGPYVADL
jgi:hypothetical protein